MSAEAGTDGRVQISRDLLMEQLMMNKDQFQHDGFGNVRSVRAREYHFHSLTKSTHAKNTISIRYVNSLQSSITARDDTQVVLSNASTSLLSS